MTNLWFTTDKTNCLNAWNLLNERLEYSIKSFKIKGSIFDIAEIMYLKLIAIGSTNSTDKLITIWNPFTRSLLITLDFFFGGIHSFVFSNSYQVLLTAGYENNISVFDINAEYLDHNLIGKLVGHNSMVTALTVVE